MDCKREVPIILAGREVYYRLPTGKRGIWRPGSRTFLTGPPMNGEPGQLWPDFGPPYRLGAVGNGTLALHCLTSWGQWAFELLQYTASLYWGSGQCNSFNALPHYLGAVGSGTRAMHCLTA